MRCKAQCFIQWNRICRESSTRHAGNLHAGPHRLMNKRLLTTAQDPSDEKRGFHGDARISILGPACQMPERLPQRPVAQGSSLPARSASTRRSTSAKTWSIVSNLSFRRALTLPVSTGFVVV